MFVHGYRFVNPWHEPDCPPRGVHFCKTRQGGGDVADNIASTEGKIVSLDGANVRHEEVKTATRTKLAVVVGPLTTATEMKTHAYVLHSLLGGGDPIGGGHSPPLYTGSIGTRWSGCASWRSRRPRHGSPTTCCGSYRRI